MAFTIHVKETMDAMCQKGNLWCQVGDHHPFLTSSRLAPTLTTLPSHRLPVFALQPLSLSSPSFFTASFSNDSAALSASVDAFTGDFPRRADIFS